DPLACCLPGRGGIERPPGRPSPRTGSVDLASVPGRSGSLWHATAAAPRPQAPAWATPRRAGGEKFTVSETISPECVSRRPVVMKRIPLRYFCWLPLALLPLLNGPAGGGGERAERAERKSRLRRPVALVLADEGRWLFTANRNSG